MSGLSPSKKRRLYKLYHQYEKFVHEEWAERGYPYPPPDLPPYPDELLDILCGAKTRAGTPCKRRDLHTNGRCKFHGGLSTGPQSDSGKAPLCLKWKNTQEKANPMRR